MSDLISRLIVPGASPAAGLVGYYMSKELEDSCVLCAVLGSTMDGSVINHALGFEDLVPSSPAPAITSGQPGASCTDGGRFFFTDMMPADAITIGAVTKRVSGQAPILSTAYSSVIGGYGFNLFWSSSGGLQFIRLMNNAGTPQTLNTSLSVTNSTLWHRVIATGNADAQQLYCPTNGSSYAANSVTAPLDSTAPGPAYIGGDRATAVGGGVGVHAVIIGFTTKLSDKGRAELDTLLTKIGAAHGVAFG